MEEAAELLSLAFGQPDWVSRWLHRWLLLTRLRADLRRQLGEETYHAAWERGGGRDLETAIRSLYSLPDEFPRRTANRPLLEPLSEREVEVLGLIAEGLSNREIAQRLVLSVGTVCTLPHIGACLRQERWKPELYGGVPALHMLAHTMHTYVPEKLAVHLLYFALPWVSGTRWMPSSF